MHTDQRDLLDVLEFELEFLEKGGYEDSAQTNWRPLLIFEDSPACMNHDQKETPGPCSDCVLMQLVPPEAHSEKFPCRHIVLNERGETLDSLYRSSDSQEIKEIVAGWLRQTIAKLKAEREVSDTDGSNENVIRSGSLKGTPLYQNQNPKCANPLCPAVFRWVAGGKFFRFRIDIASANSHDPASELRQNTHGVQHFWLCDPCSQVFTLAFDDNLGVVVKLLRLGFTLTAGHKESSAA